MASIRDLSRAIKARCPRCGQSLSLADYSFELFERMLIELIRRGRIEMPGFGVFEVRIGSYSLKHIKTGAALEGKRKRVVFRSAHRLRTVVNMPETSDIKFFGGANYKRYEPGESPIRLESRIKKQPRIRSTTEKDR